MSDISSSDFPATVAVLEEIVRGTKAALERIERRLGNISNEQRADFGWLPGVMIGWGVALPGAMAHGFHWV